MTYEISWETGVLFGLVNVLGWELFRHYRKFACMERAYWGERKGRTRVEQEMRRLAKVQLNTSEGFFVQPIGTIESCYKQCIGTPRQGALVPSSKAIARLTPNMSPEALDGLEAFSHVWLTFQFHLNTNVLKEAKAFSGLQDSNKRFTFTAKITPPMLKRKVGVLSTRSPHRPNAIGVTLARVERVDKRDRCLHLSACDLVHGTPVLDIKPYVPMYDTVPGDCKVPTWIAETVETRNIVSIRLGVREKLRSLICHCRLYKNDEEGFVRGVVETLEADVRSKFQTKRAIKDADKGVVRLQPFDELTIRYEWKDDREIDIIDVVRGTITPTNEVDGGVADVDEVSEAPRQCELEQKLEGEEK